MSDFDRSMREALKNKPPTQAWYVVSYRNENTGAFACAVILKAKNSVEAAMNAYKIAKVDPVDLSGTAEIPEKRMPAEEYRNRLLSRSDVETIWPDFFKG